MPRRKSFRNIAAALAVSAFALAASGVTTPAMGAVRSPEIIQPTAGATQINLIGFNDFHGRIMQAEAFAATVLAAEQPFGADRSLVLSGGDLVGASVFESSIAQDQPTIDFAGLLGVDAYTLGNHEFDRGGADAIERIQPATAGPDLAANVTRSDGSHPFATHTIATVQGVRVAIIGAVTAETPSFVTPDSIAGLQFGDPVEAVNRVAAELTATGAADVIIASYHDGGPGEDEASNRSSDAFNAMADRTSPEVDVIFNGHTHGQYALELTAGTGTRPVVQAGSYGEAIAQVVLTVGADGTVTADSSLIPRLESAAIPADIAASPSVTQVRELVGRTAADAEALGQRLVGKQHGDITRAKRYEPGTVQVDAATGQTSGGVVTGQDDRASASSLGDVVAQSMLDAANGSGHRADLAFINPGGVRADLLDDDGTITYREAQQVLPFTNNLSVVTVTGAVLKQILEEQWQLDEQGQVPSRPYLQLGMSDGIEYAYDAQRPQGERIMSITLAGTPIDPAATYRVVTTAFMASGGDNFRGFRAAVSSTDTGLVDLDAFTQWIAGHSGEGQSGIGPDLRRNSMQVQGLPAQPMTCGDQVELIVSDVDQASLGYVQNASVSAMLSWTGPDGAPRQAEIGSAQIGQDAPRSAKLGVTIPADAAPGAATLSITADRSGTQATVPIELACLSPTSSADGQPSPQPDVTQTAGAPGGKDSNAGASPQGPEDAQGPQGLAQTGAEGVAGFAAVAVGAALLVIGATIVVLRRRIG